MDSAKLLRTTGPQYRTYSPGPKSQVPGPGSRPGSLAPGPVHMHIYSLLAIPYWLYSEHFVAGFGALVNSAKLLPTKRRKSGLGWGAMRHCALNPSGQKAIRNSQYS